MMPQTNHTRRNVTIGLVLAAVVVLGLLLQGVIMSSLYTAKLKVEIAPTT